MSPQKLNDVNIRRKQAFDNFTSTRLSTSIVDFVSVKKKLVIELDGSQHLEQERFAYDIERTRYLESQGYRVIRFWNNDVMNDIEGLIHALGMALSDK